jgi:hypothetical protein
LHRSHAEVAAVAEEHGTDPQMVSVWSFPRARLG